MAEAYDVALKMGGGGFSDSKMKSYVFSIPTARRTRRRDFVTIAGSLLENLRKRPGKNIWLMAAANSPATSSKTT